MKRYILTTAILLIINFCSSLQAQDTTIIKNQNQQIYPANKSCRLLLKNGITKLGYIKSEDSASIKFFTEKSGIITIQKNKIVIIINPVFESSNTNELIKIDTIHKKRIELEDGSEMHGFIESVAISGVKFRTQTGIKVVIPGDQITDIETIDIESLDGKFYTEDPNYTRLFLGPTARALKSGKGYFSVNELMFPVAAFGVTDFFTLGGGISLLPFASDQAYYLIAKVTPVNIENFALSGGILHANTIGRESDFKGVGLAYLVSTYSGTGASLTTGLGFGYFDGEFSSNPCILLGGDVRVSNSLKLISENWILTSANSVSFLSLGLRFFSTHLAGDFGLIHPILKNSSGGFPFIPWLGFTYNF